jgi:hypothetical protein
LEEVEKEGRREKSTGVWHVLAMDPLKFHPGGPAIPYPSTPCGRATTEMDGNALEGNGLECNGKEGKRIEENRREWKRRE